MAQGQGPYLPDLSKCLAGEELMLSWDDILKSLLDHDAKPSKIYADFFEDATVKCRLSIAVPSFPFPSSQSRSSFDTRTAAISVTPGPSTQHDIDQIKSDAIWLSKELNLDELEALRMTVLEWQYRPELRLKSGYCDAELASLRDALGTEYAESAALVSGGPLSRSDQDFNTDDARHTRIIQLFFRERVRLLAVHRQIMELSLLSSLQIESLSTRSPLVRLNLPSTDDLPLHEAVSQCVGAINNRLSLLDDARVWPVGEKYSGDLTAEFVTSNLQSIAVILQTLLLCAKRSNVIVGAETLLEWLQLLQHTEWFVPFESNVLLQQESIEEIQRAAGAVSVALLNPATALARISGDEGSDISYPTLGTLKEYFLDTEKLHDLNQMVLNAAAKRIPLASESILVWSTIFLHIRSFAADAREAWESRQVPRSAEGPGSHDTGSKLSSSGQGSQRASLLEDLVNCLSSARIDDTLDFMINVAVKELEVLPFMTAVAVRCKEHPSVRSSIRVQLLQEVIMTARSALGYVPDLVTAQIAVLAPDVQGDRISRLVFNPPVNFIGDRNLLEGFLDTAAARFPYESLPFLRMCKHLAKANVFDDDGTHYITFRLKRLDFFTQAAEGGFANYLTIREDENANLVSLQKPVSVLESKATRLLNQRQEFTQDEVIPADTIGDVVGVSFPRVVRWQHSYSGLALLGKWLELYFLGQLGNVVSPFEALEEVAAESLGLLSALLESTFEKTKPIHGSDDSYQTCQALLNEAAAHLEPDATIIGYVFEIIEQQLQPYKRFPPGAGCDVFVAAVEFTDMLARIQPLLVWPRILRSSLISTSASRKNVVSVIASVEAPLQDYKLLQCCTKLLLTLVDVSLRVGYESQQSQSTLIVTKKYRSAASQKLNSAAMLSFVDSMHAAFEATTNWTFANARQKYHISRDLATAFRRLLLYSFGIGETVSTPSPLTATLLPAANFLVHALGRACCESPGGGPLFQSMLALVANLQTHPVFELPVTDDLQNSLNLLKLLIQCSTFVGGSAGKLSSQLINIAPILVRLPLCDVRLAHASWTLQRQILASYSPSLLGHLGSVSCISMLDSLQHVAGHSSDESLQSAHWQLAARLVTIDQQWLAILLITGTPPGRERKHEETLKLRTRGKPYLDRSLDMLAEIDRTPARLTIALLQFLLEAQQSWPSVTDAVMNRERFFQMLINHVCKRDLYSNSDISQALHNTITAGVTDLAVIHLRALLARRDGKLFTIFIPLLRWLTANAIDVAAYNASLHANLRKNFANKYVGLDVSMFKSGELQHADYGGDYFYDLSFTDKLLADDAYWTGSSGPQNFRGEFERANVNLSVVDSELVLLRSFKYLCVEHGSFFARNPDMQRVMAHIILNCLHANMQAVPSEVLFENLLQSRVDMALTLTRSLVGAGARGSDFTNILSMAWSAAGMRSGSYEQAIANDDLDYWRTMLSIILLALHFHVEKRQKRTNIGSGQSMEEVDLSIALYCELAARVVGEGLRTCVSSLQDQKQSKRDGSAGGASIVEQRDVMLLLNIFQAILRLPSLPQFTVQLSEALIGSGGCAASLALYSWSHFLLEGNQAIYAEPAMRLLSSLSSLPRVGEELAVEGIFSRILTARMTQSLQNVPNGVAHLDQRPNAAMLYNIWGAGMLPIALNLLHAVGGGIAAEVSSFLNQFPKQLSRAGLAISPTPTQGTEGFTLGVANELATLSLISFILDSFRNAGASAAVDPGQIQKLAGFDEHKKAVAEDVQDVIAMDAPARRKRTIATNEKEVQWQNVAVMRGASGGEGKQHSLDNRFLKELRMAVRCLGAAADEGDEGT